MSEFNKKFFGSQSDPMTRREKIFKENQIKQDQVGWGIREKPGVVKAASWLRRERLTTSKIGRPRKEMLRIEHRPRGGGKPRTLLKLDHISWVNRSHVADRRRQIKDAEKGIGKKW